MVHGTNRSTSWTDDLPKCNMTGSAMARNGRYKPDGKVDFEHDFEDRHLCVRYNAGTFLYGVFDGHDGSARAAEYAQDKFPADLLYERLPKAQCERDLCDALRLSFLAVEGGFFASLDATLARRANIHGQLPPGLNDYQLYEQAPGLITELQAVNEAITGGTTAALALLHNNSLFAANVGDSRVILATCANSVLPMIRQASGGLAPAQDLVEAHQLTVDHDASNESELDRLSSIGLDRDRIRRSGRVGSHENTRSIGDYSMKGGYKEFEEVRQALSEPVIAEPFIQHALPVQSNWLFMFLMSDGVYKAVEESHGLPAPMANVYIAQIISHLLLSSTSIQAATEGALNYILTDHLKAFLSGNADKKVKCRKRDDCTLVVRCFHHAVPAQHSPQPQDQQQQQQQQQQHAQPPPVYECVGISPATAAASPDSKLYLNTATPGAGGSSGGATTAASSHSGGFPALPPLSGSSTAVYTPTGSPLLPAGMNLSSSATSGEYAFQRLRDPLSSTSSGDKTPFFSTSQPGQLDMFARQTSAGVPALATPVPSVLLSTSSTSVQSNASGVAAASPSQHASTGSDSGFVDRTTTSQTPSSVPAASPARPTSADRQREPLERSQCPANMVTPHPAFSVPPNFPDHFPPDHEI